MALKRATYFLGIQDLQKYLTIDGNEDAKAPLIHTFFREIFGDDFVIESDAEMADGYVKGQLVVETKTSSNQWLAGFFQALHYQKKGLSFPYLTVIARHFCALWRVDEIPEFAKILHTQTDPALPAQKVGVLNASKCSKAEKRQILDTARFSTKKTEIEDEHFVASANLFMYYQAIKNLEKGRIQINTKNFISTIQQMERFFDNPIDAIHAFYTIVGYWDITSTVPYPMPNSPDLLTVNGKQGRAPSDAIKIHPRFHNDFRKFIEQRYVFSNEGSGLSLDYYFSRFDEAIAKVFPKYTKQHGIFFTNDNLAKFAIWYLKTKVSESIGNDYIIFDPAGGSGNLVTSWRYQLKHKIISELQPDLLKIIERRVKLDEWHQQNGQFTIVPKTKTGTGLNFITQSAKDYLNILRIALNENNLDINKPFCFLLNPPYKSTKENEDERIETDSSYSIHQSILELTGNEAGLERYISFVAQIQLISDYLFNEYGHKSLLVIFTPTSWLIPRPVYREFRAKFDSRFLFRGGFFVKSNEFFKVEGSWPVALTIWEYTPEENRVNTIVLDDFSVLDSKTLDINWLGDFNEIDEKVGKLILQHKSINFSQGRSSIRTLIAQPSLGPIRTPTKAEKKQKVYGGLPLMDPRRGNEKTYGYPDGSKIGFMDDCTPFRLHDDNLNRLSNLPDRVWFYLDYRMIAVNVNKIFSSVPDGRGYCANDLKSAQQLFSWWALTKCLVGNYPLWANQFDVWEPNFSTFYPDWLELAFALGLAENRCVVTLFPQDDPLPGVNPIFIDNPLSTNNPKSFWSQVLLSQISTNGIAADLVSAITELYSFWNQNYTLGQRIPAWPLEHEPYFKYFIMNNSEYEPFLSPNSGLIQIKKYAELTGNNEINLRFDNINKKSKLVRDKLCNILFNKCNYFG